MFTYRSSAYEPDEEFHSRNNELVPEKFAISWMYTSGFLGKWVAQVSPPDAMCASAKEKPSWQLNTQHAELEQETPWRTENSPVYRAYRQSVVSVCPAADFTGVPREQMQEKFGRSRARGTK